MDSLAIFDDPGRGVVGYVMPADGGYALTVASDDPAAVKALGREFGLRLDGMIRT